MTTATQFYPNESQRRAQMTSTPEISETAIDSSSQDSETIQKINKQLQPDEVVLSAEAKSAAAEEKEAENKKNIDASSLNGVMSPEEAAAAKKSGESDLDKEIRELAMKVLELSVKIQLLQDKEDKESVKERRALEVDLAITKGQLDAAIKRKLEQAAVSE